jgi:hypothetical protein
MFLRRANTVVCPTWLQSTKPRRNRALSLYFVMRCSRPSLYGKSPLVCAKRAFGEQQVHALVQANALIISLVH